jgi:hypothetical protein
MRSYPAVNRVKTPENVSQNSFLIPASQKVAITACKNQEFRTAPFTGEKELSRYINPVRCPGARQ